MKRKGIVDLGGKNFAEFLNAELCIILIIKLAKLLNFASHQITIQIHRVVITYLTAVHRCKFTSKS